MTVKTLFVTSSRVRHGNYDVWRNLSQNWIDFFWLTGETPQTFNSLVRKLEAIYRNRYRMRRGVLDFRNKVKYLHRNLNSTCKSQQFQYQISIMSTCDVFLQVLLTMIWLRKYPTMTYLSTHFGISVGCVHKIIHRLLPILHSYVVPRFIKWHSMNHWRRLSGIFPEWPRVVAIIDGTPFRISRPKGK